MMKINVFMFLAPGVLIACTSDDGWIHLFQ